jgi:hypothetical protein
VLNKAPPIDVYYRDSTYFRSPFGDTRLRSYWVQADKRF